jgi:hypothetical protein
MGGLQACPGLASRRPKLNGAFDMKKLYGGLIAVIALSGGALALAQTAAAELTAKDVIAKLESAGYTAITDVEKDDGVWEVDATSPAGEPVELDIDPASGKVLREQPDDRD